MGLPYTDHKAPKRLARGTKHSMKWASLCHMTYLLTQVPALGTVPQEKGPSVFQMVWEGASGDGEGGALDRVCMRAMSP